MIWGLIFVIFGLLAMVSGLFLVNEPLAGIVFGVVLMIFGGLAMFGAKVIKNTPIHTVQAKIISKTTEVSGVGGIIDTAYFISFEYNGCRENAKVNLSLYNTVKEGDTGLLKYKGDGGIYEFISFDRDA